MKIGIGLAQTSWPDGAEFSPEQIVDFAVRAEDLGFDSVWTGDHLFLELNGKRQFERAETYVLLSFIAARTKRVQLGTLATCAPFRSPGQLAREAKTLADFSDGRFILGLGAGWCKPELDALDVPSDRLTSRLIEYVEALTLLFESQGPVDYDGEFVKLRGAEVPGEKHPPILLAVNGPKGIDLLARKAHGWNFAGSTAAYPEALAEVREKEIAAGRPEGSVMATASMNALLGPEDVAAKLGEQFPWLVTEDQPDKRSTVVIGAEALRTAVDRYREAGCDHLIIHLAGVPYASYGSDPLKLAADALELVAAA